MRFKMASVRPAYRQVQKYVGYVLFLVGPAAVVCRVVLCARMHHEGHVRDAETAPGLTDDAYNRVQMSRWENLWGTETVANSKGKRKAETHAEPERVHPALCSFDLDVVTGVFLSRRVSRQAHSRPPS